VDITNIKLTVRFMCFLHTGLSIVLTLSVTFNSILNNDVDYSFENVQHCSAELRLRGGGAVVNAKS